MPPVNIIQQVIPIQQGIWSCISPSSYNLGSYLISLDLSPVMLALQCLCLSGQGQKVKFFGSTDGLSGQKVSTMLMRSHVGMKGRCKETIGRTSMHWEKWQLRCSEKIWGLHHWSPKLHVLSLPDFLFLWQPGHTFCLLLFTFQNFLSHWEEQERCNYPTAEGDW